MAGNFNKESHAWYVSINVICSCMVKDLFENEVYMIEDIQRKSFTLDTLASLAKWLSVRLRTKVLVVVRVQLQSLKLQISRLFQARSSFTFRQLQSVDSL